MATRLFVAPCVLTAAFMAPVQRQFGVPAVYQVGGREYIAVPTGAGSVFQVTGGNALPAAGPPQYVIFALPAK